MAYAESEKIKVFPTSNRGTKINEAGVQKYVDPEARLNTEGNLTGILKHITDEKSFILNATKEGETILSIEFIIDGYYFNLTDPIILRLKPLYAYIKYKSEEDSQTASGYVFQQLYGEDSSDLYTGVGFTDTISEITNKNLSLQLLDGKGETPSSNYIKFRTDNEFRSVYIDDGDLD